MIKREPTIQERVKEYLAGGGLFNPELANHEAVRDLLTDAAKLLDKREAELSRIHALPDLEWIKCRAAIMQGLASISRLTDNEAIRLQLAQIVKDLDKGTLYVKRIERAANNTIQGD